MDVGTAIASNADSIPMWAAYGLTGLGLLCGIFLTFILGVLSNRNERSVGSRKDGGAESTGTIHDCANCTQIARVHEGLNALNQRIDRLLELRGVS